MSKKTKKKATAKPAAKPGLASLESGVHVSASLKRSVRPYEDVCGYRTALRELFVDASGNLVGVAACGDQAFVCTKGEIEETRDFLTQLVEARAA